MPKGLCPKCGEQKEKPKCAYCRKCGNNYAKEWSKKRSITNPETEEHREKRLSYNRARNSRLSPCQLQQDKDKAKERVARLGESYREMRKEYYMSKQMKLESGLCSQSFRCRSPLAGSTRFCLQHWMVVISNAARRKVKSGVIKLAHVDLLHLWHGQNGLCPITGTALSPGVNTHLDHIIPIARGGDNALSNLRFVHDSVNQVKGNMLDSELRTFLLTHGPKMMEWAKK